MSGDRTSVDSASPVTGLFISEDSSLRHLLAELRRLDVRIRRAVLRWQRAGQDPSDGFRGLYVSDAEAGALLDRPFGTSWGQTARLEPDEESTFAAEEARLTQEARSLAEAASPEGETTRLEKLAAAFGLDLFERDALLVCLAPALDLRYERIYGYLQDDVTRRQPAVNLILDLLAEQGPGRLAWLSSFAETAPLLRFRLLEKHPEPGGRKPNLLGQPLAVDPTVAAWLLGSYQPAGELASIARLEPPRQDPDATLLAGAAVSQLEPAFTNDGEILALYGPDEAAQEAGAGWFAARAERPLLVVSLEDAAAAGGTEAALSALRLGLRDARLTAAVPYLKGWDSLIREGEIPASLLQELSAHPGPAIAAGREIWKASGLNGMRPLRWIEFPLPGFAQRMSLWEHYTLKANPSLSAQFRLSTRQIRDAAAAALDGAAQRGEPLREADLWAAARLYSSQRLSGLARKIPPRYGWEDIVLPPDQLDILDELIAAVRGRRRVLEDWGAGEKLASSAGVTALFAGPPGTGKTLAAGIIAAELGLDLYKIDLSGVISKYIGETEKNLERIFGEAASSNAILFFDEADALFGKRSEVRDSHDRYANVEISYLLQRMEAYDGVTILATNLRANLDEAFTRRLQFAVDFPFPTEADRLRIWEALFPPGVPREPTLDFAALAGRFKLAGGGIRNAILSAAYLAAADGGVVTMDHLLHGARRELQKMGKMVDSWIV